MRRYFAIPGPQCQNTSYILSNTIASMLFINHGPRELYDGNCIWKIRAPVQRASLQFITLLLFHVCPMHQQHQSDLLCFCAFFGLPSPFCGVNMHALQMVINEKWEDMLRYVRSTGIPTDRPAAAYIHKFNRVRCRRLFSGSGYSWFRCESHIWMGQGRRGRYGVAVDLFRFLAKTIMHYVNTKYEVLFSIFHVLMVMY